MHYVAVSVISLFLELDGRTDEHIHTSVRTKCLSIKRVQVSRRPWNTSERVNLALTKKCSSLIPTKRSQS
jgi:hypothetical protein